MGAKVTQQPNPRESNPVGLLLPGMTMNETIFPDMGMPTIAVSFNDLALGADGGGESVRHRRMDLYARMLGDHLQGAPRWTEATKRIVVAHSFGGMLALRWLLTNMAALREVSGLVLIGTTAGPMFDRVRVRLELGRRTIRIPLKPFISLWNHPGLTRAVKQLVCGDLAVERVDFRELPDPTDVALDIAGWHNTDWRAMRSYRIAMEGFDVRADLTRLSVPTIVLHGTRDTLLPLSAGEELAAALPNAELWPIKGAGHGLPLTHGDWVQHAVESFTRQ